LAASVLGKINEKFRTEMPRKDLENGNACRDWSVLGYKVEYESI
jgi:hypothetical protein